MNEAVADSRSPDRYGIAEMATASCVPGGYCEARAAVGGVRAARIAG